MGSQTMDYGRKGDILGYLPPLPARVTTKTTTLLHASYGSPINLHLSLLLGRGVSPGRKWPVTCQHV